MADFPDSRLRHYRIGAAGVAIVLAALAYATTWRVPWMLDDENSILQNPTLRLPWSMTQLLSPPGGGATVQGRPLLNLSLALNYALSGSNPWSYHLFNFAVHVLTALLLFRLLERTFARRTLPGAGDAATRFAWSATIALLWLLHPLQTESVTYIVQRAESLMALWFVLTLCGFVRGLDSPRRLLWWALSVVCSVLGMATKEVMVAAPIVVLLYDVTFVAAGWRDAFARRGRYYAALAATWGLLLVLLLQSHDRGGTIGSAAGMDPLTYAQTQSRAVLYYARLVLWPHPLIFDYGTDYVGGGWHALPFVAIDAVLLALTVVAVVRRHPLGFVAASYFVILAPTSSVVGGVRQMLAEHRMYLPSAAVLAAAVIGAVTLAGRRALPVAIVAIGALGLATLSRNRTYEDAIALWRDTVVKRPLNPWAHTNLGVALRAAGRDREAIASFTRAAELGPQFSDIQNNFGNALLKQGRVDEALACFTRALHGAAIDPDIHANYAAALAEAGRRDEAVAEYREAIRLAPDHIEARNNLANLLARAGQVAAAVDEYRDVLRVDPANAEAYNNWGNALLQDGDVSAAIEKYERALTLAPGYAEASYNLGNAFARSGRIDEAIAAYRRALGLRPDHAGARGQLANALVNSGRASEAVPEYEFALRLKPNDAGLQFNLAVALVRQRRFREAQMHVDEALRLRPDFAEAASMAAWLKPRIADTPSELVH